MEEKIFEVEMIYIQNTSDSNYSVECISRRKKTLKMNFKNVEGIEINAIKPLEIKNSFLRFGKNTDNIWNLRFNYPANIKITFMEKITIETI
ncbi:MAG: hypothetical protein ABFR75_00805 [Acidobacteriota bacterium]